MLWAISEIITMNISKVLEALFDWGEYQLARRALRHSRQIREGRPPQRNLLVDEGIRT
jgi:hypothetical protein